jgi:hypothetical protein
MVRDPTGSPVTKCSLIIADKTACPRESVLFGFPAWEVEMRLTIWLYGCGARLDNHWGKRTGY